MFMDSFLAETAAIISYHFNRVTGFTNYFLATFGAMMLFVAAGIFVGNTLFLHWFTPTLSRFWMFAFVTISLFALYNTVKCILAEWRARTEGARTVIVVHYPLIGALEGFASLAFIVVIGVVPLHDPLFLPNLVFAVFFIGGTIMDFFSNAEI